MSNPTELWPDPSSGEAPGPVELERTPAPSSDASGVPAAADRAGTESSEVGESPVAGPPQAPDTRSKSKSQRVREFLEQHPEARNRDIAEALAEHGVTAADVANVKSQIRRKAEARKPRAAKPAGMKSAPARAQPPAARTPAAPPPGPARALAAESEALSIDDIEAGVALIERLGGVERARQVIALIERIRQIES